MADAGKNRLDIETLLHVHDEKQRSADAAERASQRTHWRDQKRKCDAASEGDWGGISMDPELPFQQAVKAVEAVPGEKLPPLSTTSDAMEVFRAFSEATLRYGEKCRKTESGNKEFVMPSTVVSKSMDLMESLNSLLNHTSSLEARSSHRTF